MAIPTEPTLSTRIRTLGRSAGRNAPQFAAYISGTEIDHERPGQEPEHYDYRQRAWNVEMAELLTPEGAPEWAKDRQTLWNRAEAVERRKDSQVARDLRFSFSYDLTAEQRRDLAREVAQKFVGLGMCADVAVHRYGQRWDACDEKTAEKIGQWQAWGIPFVSAEQATTLDHEHVRVTHKRDGTVKDYRLFQPHAHILLTMRPFDGSTATGFAAKSAGSQARAWNDQKLYEPLRAEIAARQNVLLAANGSPRRIDARGYEARRAEALELASAANAAGQLAEAARQSERAAQLNRSPQAYLGVIHRVKEMTSKVRQTMSQWVAYTHGKRIKSDVDALWARDHGDRIAFVTHTHRLLELARRGLGLEPEPRLALEHPDEGLEL